MTSRFVTSGSLLALTLLSFASPHTAFAGKPYSFVIVADPASTQRATEIVAFLKSTAPFSEMGNQITFSVISMSPDEMNCGNKVPEAPRVVSCDTDHIWKVASQAGANRAIIVTSQANGGAGGNPVVVSLSYPLNTVLHELIHTYGFGDEYQYSDQEAHYYECSSPYFHGRDANLAMIKPDPPYSSDADARARHGGQIPWFGDIAISTLITTGNQLGTTPAVYPTETPALYEGGDCEAQYPTWKPFYADTIMKNLNTSWVPELYQKIIVNKMSEEIGAQITLVGDGCASCAAAARGDAVPTPAPVAQ